jgi:hypothetical protein
VREDRRETDPRLAEAERLEAAFLARRAGAPDVPGALEDALASACGGIPEATPAVAAARAIAAEVERFGASFPAGAEPAYHDRHHQAEAVLAMGRLCGLARRAGRLSMADAVLGVAGMAAHDLHHDGRIPSEPLALERRSAEGAVRIAAAAGASRDWCEALSRLVLGTAMPQPGESEEVPLLRRLAHEADVCGSVLPRLGWRLSRAMASELRAAGAPGATVPGTHAGRLAFLGSIPRLTAEAEALGLGAAIRSQRAAYALCGARLAAAATAEAGAAALDRLARDDAEARLDAALAALGAPP